MPKKNSKKRGKNGLPSFLDLLKDQTPIEIVAFDEEFKKDFIEYGSFVVVDRALPDVRDGLKPVHRRILYQMLLDKFYSTNEYKKNARLVGNVMGSFHPHGDGAIYEALVKLSEWWSSNILTVDFKGNNGNVLGDKYAAARYTESRLTLFSEKVLRAVSESSVEWKDNYLNDQLEPVFLPFLYPNLLINGSFGIAVGMTSRILPHNPKEVIEATIAYIKKPSIKLEEILKIMPGPDYPTGGKIYDDGQIKEFYLTGESSLVLAGSTVIDKNKVIITEVPFNLGGSVSNFVSSLQEMILDKKLTLAKSVESYSNKNGIVIEVQVKNGESLEELEKELYSKTKLQGKYALRFNAIDKGQPKTFSLLDYFETFLNLQHDILIGKSKGAIESLNHKLEIQSGLLTALDLVDPIVEFIRNSNSRSEIISGLQDGNKIDPKKFKTKKNAKEANNFNFSLTQAEYIFSLPLGRISNLSKVETEKELKRIEREIKKEESILHSETKRKNIILKTLEEFLELPEIKNMKRRTQILQGSGISYVEAEKIIESKLAITQFGYLYNLNPDSQLPQNTIKDIDVNSTKRIGWFTSKGNYVSTPVSKLKMNNLKDKGESLPGLFKLKPDEYLFLQGIFVDIENNFEALTLTTDGKIKKFNSKELVSNRKSLSVVKSDLALAEPIQKDKKYIIAITNNGLYRKMKISDVKLAGKNAVGNLIGKLADGDFIKIAYQVEDSDNVNISGKEIKVSELELGTPTQVYKKI